MQVSAIESDSNRSRSSCFKAGNPLEPNIGVGVISKANQPSDGFDPRSVNPRRAASETDFFLARKDNRSRGASNQPNKADARAH